jgi:hypothetical protein
MQRFRGFELEDQHWLPSSVRNGMTDYLRFLFKSFHLYKPVVPLLKDAISACKTDKVIDLCSGSGGAVEQIKEELLLKYGLNLEFTLTDKFPNEDALEYYTNESSGKIRYHNTPVDATAVPAELEGFRTIFSSFHHFNRKDAVTILRDAATARQGIAVFYGGDKNFLIILLIILVHPITILVVTPFITPFRWSRLFYTYLVPLIPLFTVWDGVFSILSLYNPAELKVMAAEANSGSYKFETGKIRNHLGLGINYLIGIPYKV